MIFPRPISGSRKCGFTLIELLVAIGVIAVLAAVVFAGLSGADRGVALRSAQATMVNALNAARTRAVTKGVKVALMVQNDPRDRDRYRRVVAVVETVMDSPVVISTFELPANTGVLPHRNRFTAEMRESGNWTGGNTGNALGSSFLSSTMPLAIGTTVIENWEYGEIGAMGTMGGNSAILVGIVRQNPSESFPSIFVSPEQVRGMQITTYALSRMVNGRQGF